jgi:hypothetical protein
MRKAAALFVILGFLVSCGGGGGGGKKNPFPKEVADLLDDLEAAFRTGAPDDLPNDCGISLENPFRVESGQFPLDIDGHGSHAGAVPTVLASRSELRNPDGSGLWSLTLTDSADPSRLFYELVVVVRKPEIRFVAPPIGAKDFLAPDGTGQSFVLVKHEQAIEWSMSFENDPTGAGAGSLVNFSGPPSIPPVPTGTFTGRHTSLQTHLLEFRITSPGTACLEARWRVEEAEVLVRDGAGISISRLEHDHDVFAGSGAGVEAAFANRHAVIIPVGTDAVPGWPVGNGDPLTVVNGRITGGIVGYLPGQTESGVDSAGGVVTLVDDGVPPITDEDFDGVDTYDLDFTFTVGGGLNNGVVEPAILTIDSTHQEDRTGGEDLDHPILDETLLYGEMSADTETGTIIFR